MALMLVLVPQEDFGLELEVDSLELPLQKQARKLVRSDQTAAHYLLFQALDYSWEWFLVA